MANSSPQLALPELNNTNIIFILLLVFVFSVGTMLAFSGPQDSSSLPVCGDGVCNSKSEIVNCPQDCPSAKGYCGDGVCNETCSDCPQDCGKCPDYYDVGLSIRGNIEEDIRVSLLRDDSAVATRTGTASSYEFTNFSPGIITILISNFANNKTVSLEDINVQKDLSLSATLPEDFFLTGRELPDNIVEGTIGVENEMDYKEDGYVVVRYFYRDNCIPCKNPVPWKRELETLAGNMDDIVLLELFDTKYEGTSFEKWGTTSMGDTDEPVIRMEGIINGEHKYKLYYGPLLNQFYDSPQETLEEEVCKYTDYC
jgi:hypothetical protein